MADKNNHTFNVEFASRYGIEEALIFGDIYYWCIKNKENDINLKKGSDGVERYYTYNSTAALQDSYKYMTLTKVYRVIGKLEKEGLIITGCFNKRVGDRTRWYAVTEKGEQIYTDCVKFVGSTLYDLSQFSKCNLQNERHNLQNEMTLPDTNTNTNSNTNTDTKSEVVKPKKVSKTQENKNYLMSISDDIRNNSERLTKQMVCSFKMFDTNYFCSSAILLSWQVDFAKFLTESKRNVNEVSKTLNYALSDSYWTKRIFKPSNFIKSYQTIFRQSSETDEKQKSKHASHRRFDGSEMCNILDGMEVVNG